jgi:hypothetical protein
MLPVLAALVASPALLALHPAEQATLSLSGAFGAIAASAEHRLLRVSVDQLQRSITLTATGRTGEDVIRITDARGDTTEVPVRVAFDAGTIVPRATLDLTGTPADPAWIAAEVERYVRMLDVASPGARATIAAVTPPPVPLEPGEELELPVAASIGGDPSYYDVSGSTQIDVRDLALPPFAAKELLYDDDPERIVAPGLLFSADVRPGVPAHLYFYHDDGTTPKEVAVVVSAASASASTVQVTDASAGPNIDVMTVGHAASTGFMRLRAHGESVIHQVVPGAPLVLRRFALTRLQGIAGNVGLRVLSGGAVAVSVTASDAKQSPLAYLQGPHLPGDGHHRTGAFDLADYGSALLDYTVGGPDAVFEYGSRAQSPANLSADALGHDFGDYGVRWRLRYLLFNETSRPATVYLFERPLGGVLRASFRVDGAMKDMGCVRVAKAYEIDAYQLAPHQTYRLDVETMTDGGSNFPAEVGVTATPPEPASPPISSPDGCFPKHSSVLRKV